MEMKVGDFFDRYTILLQKAEFDKSAQTELVRFEEELRLILLNEINAMVGGIQERPVGLLSLEFIKSLCSLSIANAKIWENEAAIKAEYSDDPSANQKLSLEQVGSRTLVIRKHNKRRITSKSSIDKMFGNVPDKKVNHASE